MVNSSELLRVTKTFSFEMAHALSNYDGECRNIHGHSYNLAVTFLGRADNSSGGPKEGMVIDFKEIKEVVKKIISYYDHALLLHESVSSIFDAGILNQFTKTRFVHFQPTCENLLLEIKNEIDRNINKENVKLLVVRLDETATSYAEWHRCDNS